MSIKSLNFQMVLAVLTRQFNISVSCHRVAVNLAAVGEKELIFPQGKVMTLHQTLDHGFEYEVCIIVLSDKAIFYPGASFSGQ